MPGHAPPHRQLARGRDAADKLARESLLADVATLYFVDKLSQEEIARRIDRSVATVSRLLAKAKATEIVEVQVRSPVPLAPAIQEALVQRFDLRVARVVRTMPVESLPLSSLVSDLAARYISTILTDGAVVAVAWGTSVRGAVRAIAPGHHRDLQIVQALGSLGSRLPTVDNPLLIQLLADRVDGTPHYLSAPMIVSSRSIRDALASDPHFRETLRLCRQADIALVGIGEADPHRSGLCRAGYLDPREMERIRDGGAVGDVLVEFFDLQGRILETSVTDRVMGMRREDLRNAGTVIAVATGTVKVPAILGALRTGFIHVLVTDDVTARGVLDLADTVPAVDASPGIAARSAGTSPSRIPSQHRRGQRLSIAASAPSAVAESHWANPSWAREATPMRQLPARAVAATPHGASRLQDDLATILSSLVGAPQDGMALARAAGGPAFQDDPAGPRQPYRDLVLAAIERARARGELPPGADADLLVDMLFGTLWYRSRSRQEPPDLAVLRDIIAMVIRGARAAAPPRESQEPGA